MMKKNIIIIAIVVFIALAAAIYFIFRQSATKTTQEGEKTSQQANQTVPALPGFSNSETVSVQDPANTAEIKNQFQNITNENISNDTRKEGIKWFLITGSDKKPVALDDFLKASDAKIYSSVEKQLDKNNYEVFYCLDEKGKKEFGISLYANPKGFYPNRYSDIMAGMKDWEQTILLDFHSVIYPDYSFSEKDLGQKLVFKNGKYRYADVALPDGQKSSINYENFGDVVVVVASVECMDRVSLIVAPPEN